MANKGNTENVMARDRRPGRPRAKGELKIYSFKLRRGRSAEEDSLIDRLEQLTGTGQRSRFIRRVLTTGDIDPILDREFARESEWAAASLAGLGSWGDDEED